MKISCRLAVFSGREIRSPYYSIYFGKTSINEKLYFSSIMETKATLAVSASLCSWRDWTYA